MTVSESLALEEPGLWILSHEKNAVALMWLKQTLFIAPPVAMKHCNRIVGFESFASRVAGIVVDSAVHQTRAQVWRRRLQYGNLRRRFHYRNAGKKKWPRGQWDGSSSFNE
jgi:hypothetical protein